jgi:hypothetical protein
MGYSKAERPTREIGVRRLRLVRENLLASKTYGVGEQPCSTKGRAPYKGSDPSLTVETAHNSRTR